jgi:hypothetical protein
MARNEPDDELKAPSSVADICPERNSSTWTHRQRRAGEQEWSGLSPLAACSPHHLTGVLPSRTARFQVKAFELVVAPTGVGGWKARIPRFVTLWL